MRSFMFRAAAMALVFAPAASFAQTSSNPPGTAAGRAFDRAAGTDTSGAYPAQADGTRENPKGTVVGRATRRATAKVRHSKQTPADNSATRAVDRAAGTNNSGAYPAQSDGTPGSPPGTAVSRALGTTNTK